MDCAPETGGVAITVRDFARRIVRRISRLVSPKVAPRHTNDYATLVPVLVGIGHVLRTKSVLELGAGRHSTTTFLNRTAFPDLSRLVSYEDDPTWAAQVEALAGYDQRLNLLLVSGVAPSVGRLSLADYDLILVDDSHSMDKRIATIEALSSKHDVSCLVLIHDFEIPEYRGAASRFTHRFVFDALTPQVGALWNSNVPMKRDLKRLNRNIRRTIKTSPDLDPGDITGWVRALSR